MPRFRTTAIAALAASALLATSGAAYARDLHLKKAAREASEVPSMSWAYSKGKLSDLSTATPDVFDGARATAFMMGINGESTFRLNVRGVDKDAVGKTYPAHLHEGPCVAGDGAAAGGHYNISGINPETKLFNEVSAKTEAWLTFKVTSDEDARITVTVPFVTKPGERSIVIHTDAKPDPGKSPARLACLPLDIKSFSSSD
jgi:Cu-Zn family superoxide dismutase